MKILLLLLLISCAKVSYMTEQGVGQVALEWNGTSNEKVLANPEVSDEHKRKIKVVQKAKKYFYDYYGLESNSIYDQTTFLDQKAVSYLVTHSPADKIVAQKTCFPIAGCFPYLGFFKKDSAIKHKKKMEQAGYQTFMRPVYAYSTLNHPLIPFSDNILSSFFHYKDEQLVHLIFHELVHTVIFVKDEAQFNENLAEFISDSMMIDYLGLEKNYVEKQYARKELGRKFSRFIYLQGQTLNKLYKQSTNKHEYTLRNFLKNIFEPQVKLECEKLKLKNCWPLKEKWNNARFAAYSTYTGKRDEILEVYKKMNLPLKDFLLRLIELEDDFDHDEPFINYIKKEGTK